MRLWPFDKPRLYITNCAIPNPTGASLFPRHRASGTEAGRATRADHHRMHRPVLAGVVYLDQWLDDERFGMMPER